MDLEDVAGYMIFVGLILMAVAVVAALIPLIAPVRRNRGQEQPARKAVATGRWFHWLFLWGVVLFVLATGVLFVTVYSRYFSPARVLYSPTTFFLCGLLLVLLAIGTRCGVAAAARHSVWVFILALLAAITFPEVIAPTHKARQAACQSNLKQIGIALRMYAEANDDKLPPAHSWAQAIWPYVGIEDLYLCPTTGKTYIFNEALAGKSLEDIADPAQMPVAWDTLTDDGKPPHSGGFNVLFLDGHVDWFKLAEFRELMRGAQKDAELP